MAAGAAISGSMDELEKDLTCSICTDILYQPLTLLDCLHSFCGSCLREWFSWQATSAVQNRRSQRSNPYTCPSCREPVRSTKVYWRLTTWLEGYIKAHPERDKTDQEKSDIALHYKPGDDVLPPLAQVYAQSPRHGHDHRQGSGPGSGHEAGAGTRGRDGSNEEEALQAHMRELTMAGVDPDTARRRAERAARHHRPAAETESTPRLTEARMREHDAGGPHIGHQPSLRSLLSVSDADPQDVQAEILQSIYSEGLLDGIDIDNLTTEQEEELTERIADAYRRRQRRRARSRSNEHRRVDRSRSQDRSQRDDVAASRDTPTSSHMRPDGADVNGGAAAAAAALNPAVSTVATVQTPSSSGLHPPSPRAHGSDRPGSQEQQNRHRRSTSATSQQSSHSASHESAHRTSRAATDASLQRPDADRAPSGRHVPSSERQTVDQHGYSTSQDLQSRPGARSRVSSNDGGAVHSQQSGDGTRPDASRRQTARIDTPVEVPPTVHSLAVNAQQSVRPAVSKSTFAPEVVSNIEQPLAVPSINCSRCNKRDIQNDLHYNCSTCSNGSFNLCLQCYRDGKGCRHWFGFGYRGFERYSNILKQDGNLPNESPHVLIARRYVQPNAPRPASRPTLEEGAFCERCFAFSNDSYWYCGICLDGAWGFCENCVKRGNHCTHDLLPVAHINTLAASTPYRDPAGTTFVPLPHMRPDTYLALPMQTECDICAQPVAPDTAYHHCHECSGGDYDVCTDCHRTLAARTNSAVAWRRCPNRHRMALVSYRTADDGSRWRCVVRAPVGGFAFKEDASSVSDPPAACPPDGGAGLQCLALYSYFPGNSVTDELAFPKNALITEVGVLNDDWYRGVYAGDVNLFPSNHVRIV